VIIQVKKVAADLKIRLPDLITRPMGKRVYGRISKRLEHAGEGEVVVLDFEGIKVIDSSFIDECLIRLILDSRASGRVFYIKLCNISDIAEINLDLVLNSYYMYNNEKIAVITDRVTHNNSVFLGVLSKLERDIVDYLRVNKTARLEDLAALVSAPEGKARAIVDELFRIRVVRRDGAGEAIRYAAV
jgi:hypothetical protein